MARCPRTRLTPSSKPHFRNESGSGAVVGGALRARLLRANPTRSLRKECAPLTQRRAPAVASCEPGSAYGGAQGALPAVQESSQEIYLDPSGSLTVVCTHCKQYSDLN